MYGMMVNEKELDKLEKAGVQYEFFDVEAMISGNAGDTVEIVFDSEEDYIKAKQILGR